MTRFPDLGLRRRRRGLSIGPIGPIATGPSAPSFSFGPGANPGEVELIISGAPESLGDGPVGGDGSGTFEGIVVRIGDNLPVTYDETIPRTIVSSGHPPGSDVSAMVQALGYMGRPGERAFGLTQAAVAPPGPADGPSVPIFSYTTGSAVGEVVLTISGAPMRLGDGPVAGDGQGVLSWIVVTIGNGASVTYDATIPRTIVSGGHAPGSDVPATIQAIGYGGRAGEVGGAVAQAALAQAAPSEPIIEVMSGDLPGQIKIRITAPPEDLGDGPVAGDGNGLVTDYQVAAAGGPFISRGASLPIEVVSSGHTEGAVISASARALGFGGRVGAQVTASATASFRPSGPSVPGFTAVAGSAPGEIDLTIDAPPASFGDALVQGDGFGVVTGYGSSINGVAVDHPPTLPIERTVGGLAEGVQIPVVVWAYGYGVGPSRLVGASSARLVYPAVTPPVTTTVVGLVEQSGGFGLVDRTSGRGLVILPEES